MTPVSKAFLRKKHLELRRALSPETVRQNSEIIITSLLGFLSTLSPSLICSYLAYDNEPDLSSLPGKLAQTEFYYPVTAEKRTMSFYRMNPEDRAILDSRGIPIPEKRNQILSDSALPSKIIFLVPGICFSKKGARIGSGCGYYDRFLARYDGKSRPILIGIAHECQISGQEWKEEKSDIPMDHIITEKRIMHREAIDETL